VIGDDEVNAEIVRLLLKYT